MSLPIAPRPSQGGGDQPPLSPAVLKARKISTACGACKQRKTRCTGGNPCEACATRNSDCIYDAAADQRRKIANQRNVQDLAEAQLELNRYREVLGGVLAIVRAGGTRSTNDLIDIVRSRIDLSTLAAYVRNEVRASMSVEQAFHTIDFNMDSGLDLPSPSQLLSRLDSGPQLPQSHTTSESTSGSASNYDPALTR